MRKNKEKTDMVDYFNKIINTEQRYACISRPRRFGKTMAVNMLAAYYEKGSDARRLFENQNDMTSFKTKDDVMTLLIHLGYLRG